jgi:hypothetical protein
MEHRPYSEAYNLNRSTETKRSLPVQKFPPLDRILSQLNPVHNIALYLEPF